MSLWRLQQIVRLLLWLDLVRDLAGDAILNNPRVLRLLCEHRRSRRSQADHARKNLMSHKALT